MSTQQVIWIGGGSGHLDQVTITFHVTRHDLHLTCKARYMSISYRGTCFLHKSFFFRKPSWNLSRKYSFRLQKWARTHPYWTNWKGHPIDPIYFRWYCLCQYIHFQTCKYVSLSVSKFAFLAPKVVFTSLENLLHTLKYFQKPQINANYCCKESCIQAVQ